MADLGKAVVMADLGKAVMMADLGKAVVMVDPRKAVYAAGKAVVAMAIAMVATVL